MSRDRPIGGDDSASAIEIRRFKVGMSVDALASAWARQEDAASGSTVVVDTEISGRLRGGVPWKGAHPDCLMMAMVVRPQIRPNEESLLWLAVTLAAARAIESEGGREAAALWPDSVGAVGETPVCSTNVGVQLGPDRINHAVLSVRANLDLAGLHDRESLLGAFVAELSNAMTQLDSEPLVLLEAFNEAYPLLGQLVQATLLPRGSARGRVAAIDPSGDLVLESTTGMLERVMASSLRSLQLA